MLDKIETNKCKCGNTKRKDRDRCKACISKYDRERRLKFKKAGICPICRQQKLSSVEVSCSDCKLKDLENHRKRQILWQESGLCESCGKVKEDSTKTKCSTCLIINCDIKTKTYESRKSKGFCVKHDGEPATIGLYCRECWFKCITSSALGTQLYYKEVMRLWDDQKGLCAFSGVILVPGVNASLDHKIPRSAGGLDEISNLHWVDINLNRLKWDQNYSEFLNAIPKYIKMLENTLDRENEKY